ncbi:MAG: sigma-54-dependent Fis family transcriptional regulator [Magnetococcales bacterium]|nr:sigma-54-dependent Fis family transcriptional regulator [Magnetococcales bacterium]
MSEPVRVLLVDRDKVALQILEHILRKEGCRVMTAPGGASALQYLERHAADPEPVEVILADLGLDPVDESHFLRHCLRLLPASALIFVSDTISVSSVVDVIRQGAFHYLIKPIRPQDLRQAVASAAENSRRQAAQQGNPATAMVSGLRDPLITQDPVMLRLLTQVSRIAGLQLPVLITGETGTGKEILARLVHERSARANKPFVAVNCGAFQEELLANELFGHAREAFTGAVRDRKGVLDAAEGGTLFLDEITEMSLSMQVKLLRVIQEKELLRLGMSKPVPIDVRFMAASNRDIRQEVEAGRFRRDLYYRLNVMDFHLPPLAARPGDIPLLVRHFIEKHARALNRRITGITPQALDLLSAQHYPGNVRELENVVLRAVAFANTPEVGVDDLPESWRGKEPFGFLQSSDNTSYLSLEEMAQRYIVWICQETRGNQGLAAKILGLDRVSLWRRLKKIRARSDLAQPLALPSDERS